MRKRLKKKKCKTIYLIIERIEGVMKQRAYSNPARTQFLWERYDK